MDDFLAKPFKINDLERMLSQWLPAKDTTLTMPTKPSLTAIEPSIEADSAKVVTCSATVHAEYNKSMTQSDATGTPVPDTEPEPPQLDVAIIEEMRKDYDEQFIEVLDAFTESMPETLALLRTAMDTNDISEVRIHAHGIKGASASYGAMKLAHMCRTLENQAKLGQVIRGPEQITAIEEEITAVTRLLSQFR